MVTIPSPLQNVPGLTIGHATNEHARTGCTVVGFDRPALTAVEVRGAAPATRETDLLAAGRTVQRADAIVLTGGSAFGLAAADGVAGALACNGRGFSTSAGPVPIVPAAAIFDLAHGERAAPTAEDGATAYRSATSLPDVRQMQAGAGTGATVGKILGSSQPLTGGFGIAQRFIGAHSVTAMAVVNSFGIPVAIWDNVHDPRELLLEREISALPLSESTTLVVVVTTIPCDHGVLTRACVAAHDAIARAILPAHTILDGDVMFASTMSEGTITMDDAMKLTMATELSVEAAIGAACQVIAQ